MATGNRPKWKAPHHVAPSKPERRRMTCFSSRSIQKGANTLFKATEGRTTAMKDRWDSLNHSKDIKGSRISAKEYHREDEAAKSINSATSK